MKKTIRQKYIILKLEQHHQEVTHGYNYCSKLVAERYRIGQEQHPTVQNLIAMKERYANRQADLAYRIEQAERYGEVLPLPDRYDCYTSVLKDMKPEGVQRRVNMIIQKEGYAFEYDPDCECCLNDKPHDARVHYRNLVELQDRIFRRRHGLL